MLYEGTNDVPETIDCSEVVKTGGRVKGGLIAKRELENGEEIRVSIRSSLYPSVELFTIRNVDPGDYRLVLVVIPRRKEAQPGTETGLTGESYPAGMQGASPPY
jgi:hypothetical protein